MPNDPAARLEFDFSEAPGADTLLDDLFSSEPVASTNTTTAPTTPTQPQVDEPFIKTATGTVYKSEEDAVKGIEHKDALIAELRQKLAESTGADPIRNKKQDEPEDVSYVANPKKYFEDIKKAKSEEELIHVQKKFVDEQLMPYAGLIASVAKTRAVDEVASDVPEIKTFLGSEVYKETLTSYPLLKQSVEIAESNPQVAGDLAQLYRMAYNIAAAKNLSKIAQSAPATTVAAPVARPTASSTPPPPPGVATVTPASLTTREGRQTIIKDQEARGVLDLRF